MPRKSATEVQEPGAQVQPAEREQMATQALADTRTRLDALDKRLDAIAHALSALDAEVAQAREASAVAHTEARRLPEQVRAARARLLVVAGHASASSAQAAVAEAERAVETAVAGAQDASAHAATIEDRAATQRAALESEHDALVAEQADLSGLVMHLEAEVTAAQRAQGDALLAAALATYERLHATEADARAQLADADAAVAAHRTETATRLADYPSARAQLAETALAVPVEPNAAETLIAAQLAFLGALERAGGHLDRHMAGGVALHQILRSGDGLAAALRGTHPAYTQQLRQVAEVWIAAYREGRG
jgi:hypothetical protein